MRTWLRLALLWVAFGCAHHPANLAQRPKHDQPASDFGHGVKPAQPDELWRSPEPIAPTPIP
jgi:hypothetical protein